MLGELSRSGVGKPTHVDCVKSIAALKASCSSSNAELVKELREDSHAQALLASTQEDAALGRMSPLVSADETDMSKVLLNPRFSVMQEKDDGSSKVRAIDHLSWSPLGSETRDAEHRPSKRARKEGSVNGHTVPAEKLSHDTLDMLAAAMCKSKELMGKPPGLIKGDIDAAFRRIPVAAEHRWACGIAFLVDGKVHIGIGVGGLRCACDFPLVGESVATCSMSVWRCGLSTCMGKSGRCNRPHSPKVSEARGAQIC